MYLDRSYTPRRRGRNRFPWWPLILLAVIGIVLYEQRPAWLSSDILSPTPVPTRNAISHLREAEIAERESDFERAIEAYQQVTILEPTSAEPLIAQSNLQMILRDRDKAQELAERAVELEPENVDALAALARALDWQGKYDAAFQIAFDGLDLEPENPNILAVLGEIYSDQLNWQLAEVHLNNAFQIAPKNLLVLRNLAYLEETRGEYEKAIEYYNAAIELAPYRYDFYIERGRQESFGLEDYEAALTSYLQASEVYPSATTLDAYGFGLYNMNDRQKAVRVLRQAVELDENHGLANVHLGMTYYALRNYEDAALSLAKGVEVLGDESRIEHYYTLGLAHVYRAPYEDDEIEETKEEQCQKAIPWLQKALEIEATSRPALQGLAEC